MVGQSSADAATTRGGLEAQREWLAQARLSIHFHKALCSQEARPHRRSERFVGDGRLRLGG